MKKYLSLLCLLPLTLAACAKTGVDFPVTDDQDLIYLMRNGENIGSVEKESKNLLRESNGTDLIARIKAGEQLFIYCHQQICPACRVSEEAITAYLRDSQVLGYSLYNAQGGDNVVKAALDALKDEFYDFREVIGPDYEYHTPAAYLVKDSAHIVEVNFTDNRSDKIALENQFKALANYTALYEFETAAAFLDFTKKNDCFYILDASTTFSGTFQSLVYPYAIHSQKKTAYVRYSKLSDEDKAAIAAGLGNGDSKLAGTFKNGVNSMINYGVSLASLKDVISSYFDVEFPTSSESSSSEGQTESSSEASVSSVSSVSQAS